MRPCLIAQRRRDDSRVAWPSGQGRATPAWPPAFFAELHMETKDSVEALRALVRQVQGWLDERGKAGEIVCGQDRLTFLLSTKNAFERVYVALLLDHGHAAEALKQLYNAIVAALSQLEIDDPQRWADTVFSSCGDLMLRCYGLAKEMEAAPGEAGGDLSETEKLKTRLCPHTSDFRTMNWFDTTYTFTSYQAACIKVWWQYWRTPARDVGDETVLLAAGCESKRISDIFKRHPAWREMIVEGGARGTHRLREPTEERPTKNRARKK